MWQARLYCPSCREPLFEYDFQLEGEVSGPDADQPFACEGCGWKGVFAELSSEPPVAAPPELDFQI